MFGWFGLYFTGGVGSVEVFRNVGGEGFFRLSVRFGFGLVFFRKFGLRLGLDRISWFLL